MRRAVGVTALSLAFIALAACGLQTEPTSKSPETATPPPADRVSTVAPNPDSDPTAQDPSVRGNAEVLHSLAVKGRAPVTGYSREQFGPAWSDTDNNGCDTRNDVLRRDLDQIEEAGGCTILSGLLADPYTATSIPFVEGGASEVDIDHVVALGNAWQTGASNWTDGKRLAFANDPLNLLAVDASANRHKGDGDAATWLPPNKPFRCAYIATQIAVKDKYDLWVTKPEQAAMGRILARCPQEPIQNPPATRSPGGGAPRHTSDPTKTPSSARHFRLCADAEAAGVTPLMRGTRLYRANRSLDSDHDGVACE